MRVALHTVFGVTPRARNRFLGWRLARGVTPKNARRHPENGGMAPHQFFENNYFSEANQLRVLTLHEGHMGHYHHWRTDDSSSSCFCAIVNVGKMRGVTLTDATEWLTKDLHVLLRHCRILACVFPYIKGPSNLFINVM